MPFLTSPPALRTQQLAGFRSLATQTAVSTPLPALERSFSTPQTNNTAFGAAALLFNTTGRQHSRWSGRPFKQHEGINNTATGESALMNNTTGDR